MNLYDYFLINIYETIFIWNNNNNTKFFLIFSCFDNNWYTSHLKLNICEFTKINLNHLDFHYIYVCVCVEPTL